VEIEDLRKSLAQTFNRPLETVEMISDISEIKSGDFLTCLTSLESQGDFFQISSIYLDPLPADLSILDAAAGLARSLQRTVYVMNDDEPSNPYAFMKVPPNGVATKLYVDPDELDHHDRYVVLEPKSN